MGRRNASGGALVCNVQQAARLPNKGGDSVAGGLSRLGMCEREGDGPSYGVRA